MTSKQWSHIRDVLAQALDHPPEERTVWLKTVYSEEPDVRAEVASLLDAYEPDDPLFSSRERFAPDWFAAPSHVKGSAQTEEEPGCVRKGAQIGAYRLLEKIGTGGMSVVYRAERADDSVEQTVAIKLLRPLHAEDAERRFRAEQQVLASLDHPNIAQFVDGGTAANGQFYLVMEYVEGTPITDYADEQDLDVAARLDLLEQVMDAVQAAHRQFVVHRDVKPSNVLITQTETGPRVKLLDFGIAKLLGDAIPVTRPQTWTRHLLLTPSYAALEQVTEGDISTVTDVYQIGVLAYELLSGVRPLDLEGKRPSKMEQIITTRMPALPSEAAGPPRESVLRGDLDLIVQTTLRKEPQRRYGSIEALAADLRRYRRGQTVDARPATLGYRARKFIKRNRVGVSVGATFVILLTVFVGLLIRQQRIMAAQRDRARHEAATEEQVSSFLTSLFEANRPFETRRDTITARQLLSRGVTRAEVLKDQPLVQARMLREMGISYRSLGEYEQAESLFRRALALHRERTDPPTAKMAKSLNELGIVLKDRNQFAAADSIHRAALALRRKRLGPAHVETAESLDNLAIVLNKKNKPATADSLFRNALAILTAKRGPRHLKTASTLNNLAVALSDQAKYAAADSLFRTALAIHQNKLGPRHPEAAEILHNLGLLLAERGNYAAADSLLQKVMTIEQEYFSPDHQANATTLSNLADVWEEQGKYAAAESAYREALAIEREQFGPNHLGTTVTMNNLAILYEKMGDYAVAESLYAKLFSIEREHYGPRHPTVSTTYNNWGVVLERKGRYATADSVYREALAIERQTLGERHPEVAETIAGLARVQRDQGHDREAAHLLEQALAIPRAKLRDNHPKIKVVAQRLASLYHERGEPARNHSFPSVADHSVEASPPKTATTPP